MKNFIGGFVFSVLMLAALQAHAAPPAGTVDGCEGEGCGCFEEYHKDANPEGALRDYDIAVVKPFTLYADHDTASFVIGQFEPGTKARPVSQFIQFANKGKYIVQAVKVPNLGLKAGDVVDSEINDGEGLLRIDHQGKWIGFDSSEQEVTLKTVTPTKTQDWTEVQVGDKKGFTLDTPFAMCGG